MWHTLRKVTEPQILILDVVFLQCFKPESALTKSVKELGELRLR